MRTMYSRKFGQNGVPADYSGVSFRQTQNPPSPPPDTTECEDDRSSDCLPRYPTEIRPRPGKSYTFKRIKTKNPKTVPAPVNTEKERKSGLSALTSRSFTMEDIVLAGLILLLLNSDCDSELILILGFLLLVGLQ